MILGIADSVNGVPIRLTDERWEHILDSHPELVSVGARHRQSEYRQQLSFFDRVEADEFIFTDAGGGVTTKKQDLEGLKQPANPDVKLVAYDVDEMNVLLYDKTAVTKILVAESFCRIPTATDTASPLLTRGLLTPTPNHQHKYFASRV